MKLYRILIALLQFFIGITAIKGGYGLVFNNGLGMPLSQLSGSPFSSYLIPGLILMIVIGGTSILSGILTVKNVRFFPESLAISGFGLQIWIVTELFILPQGHFLQALYFAFSLITLISVMLFVKYQRGGSGG